jgi:hypothetical protein
MVQPLRRSILALPLLLLLAPPAAAAEKETPSEMAADALAKMIGALEQLIEAIPQYEKPEVTENGDIIIRRKRPNGPPRLPEPGAKDEPGKGRAI